MAPKEWSRRRPGPSEIRRAERQRGTLASFCEPRRLAACLIARLDSWLLVLPGASRWIDFPYLGLSISRCRERRTRLPLD